jgi:hypothetical protein
VELSLRTRVRAGDKDAFGLLFEEHARAVYNHAAEALRVPVGTVRSRLSRARRKLQEFAGTAEHGPGGDLHPIREQVAGERENALRPVKEGPDERQVWLPVANICVTGLLKEGGSTELLSPFLIKVNPDGSEKVEYPSKPSDWNNYTFRCPSEGHLGETYRLLQSLPTNPTALLSYLKSQKTYTNDDPLQEIFDTLTENIMPPAVAAAFYRVAACRYLRGRSAAHVVGDLPLNSWAFSR